MARSPLLLVGLLGFLLAGGFAAVALDRPLDQGPVYSVAQVQAELAHRPGAWVGRTVWVRGRAEGCYATPAPAGPRCTRWEPRLSEPHGGATSEPLLLARGDPHPALAFLRRLPLLRSLLPAPQAIAWGAIATYRVRLRPVADVLCGDTCYQALVLDAAP